MKHGFSQTRWNAGKNEGRAIMIERAQVRGSIPYSDVARGIKSIKIEPHDPRLFDLLDEISREEDAAGRGMLTAVVVHKAGNMEPGSGFFKLATELGRDTSDITKCWIAELHKVHAVWGTPAKKPSPGRKKTQ
jgi:hypothetical protein